MSRTLYILIYIYYNNCQFNRPPKFLHSLYNKWQGYYPPIPDSKKAPISGGLLVLFTVSVFYTAFLAGNTKSNWD